MHFQLCGVPVLWSWHHRLHIWALLSVIGGLAVTALLWMLDLWRSRQTVFVERWSSRWMFSFAVTCTAVAPRVLETILLSVRQSLSFSVHFHLLLLFTDVVFPWFVYANITLETVAVNTPNNMAVIVTNAPAKRAPVICYLSNSGKCPIIRVFHTDCHRTQSLKCTDTGTTACKQTEEDIEYCKQKFFQCSQHKFCSSAS
jgi:hypothetical protein